VRTTMRIKGVESDNMIRIHNVTYSMMLRSFALQFACAAFLMLLAFPPFLSSAQAQTEQALAKGEVISLEIAAPSLKGNLLETPTRQSVTIYLPPSYNSQSRRNYPVIYILHGIFDSGRSWGIDFVNVPERLDELIAAGEIPELIAVMPDAGNMYGGGFYRNSSVSGNWEDYIVDDLIKAIDKRYRTIARAGGRAVIGHSMGGYGAIHLAMEQPGVFSAAYAISPAMLDLSEDINFGNEVWRRVSALKTQEQILAALNDGDFWAPAALSFLTSFNPAPDKPPLYTSFPFSTVRGEVVLDQEAYAALRERLPLHRISMHGNALKKLRAFGIEYGVSDQFMHIPVATAKFSNRLTEYRIPHRLDVYQGDHRIHVPDRMSAIILPFIAGVLDPPE